MNRTDNRGSFPAGAVPIPNQLFDAVLPNLKDTELRVLLIVLRQTIGFREGSPSGGWRYKERDWISHSQMIRKTGRGSEAVSRAIDALVQRGLIVVESAAGRPLVTAAERRRFLERLYFRPAQMWITDDPRHPAKAKTTTDKRDNKKEKSYLQKRRMPAVVVKRGWQRAVQYGRLAPPALHHRRSSPTGAAGRAAGCAQERAGPDAEGVCGAAG